MMTHVVFVWGCTSAQDHASRMCSVYGCCLGVVSTYTRIRPSSPWLQMMEILGIHGPPHDKHKMLFRLRLLYSAKHHGGLSLPEFRKRCDGMGPTLTLIQNNKEYVYMCTFGCYGDDCGLDPSLVGSRRVSGRKAPTTGPMRRGRLCSG